MHENETLTSAEAKVRVGLDKVWLMEKTRGLAIYEEPDIMTCSL